jgi:hypothetical protein
MDQIKGKMESSIMRRKLFWVVLFGAAVAVAAIFYVAKVSATAASGFKATPIAVGTFGEIDVFNQFPKKDLPAGDDADVWLSMQKTKGQSDLYLLSNSWPAVNTFTGAIASTGWHTHPGHSLIIVTSGSITDYMADCVPHVYTFVPGQPSPTLVAAICTSSATKAPSRHQPSPSSSFRSIRPRPIAGLTLQPRKPAPTSCNHHGLLDGIGRGLSSPSSTRKSAVWWEWVNPDYGLYWKAAMK